MRAFKITVEFPTGTILVGGHSALPLGVDMAHARGKDGRPMIPSTALRGALRENLEAILRGTGQSVCASGTGNSPQLPHNADSTPEPVPCVLAEGERCICCRLFGGQTAALPSGARVFSSLMLGDAQLAGEAAVGWSRRQHVSIARTHRSAQSERLFLRQTPQLRDRQLVARGYTVEPELDTYLEAAVRATTHLGSGRSVGLARVELKLSWLEELTINEVEEAPDDEQRTELHLRLTLQSPTMLGGPRLGDNFRATRREIPGSVLRGAVGFAIARALAKPKTKEHETFEQLVDEHEGAHFGFLFPAGNEMPGPWPLTARACKAAPHTHGVVDTLLDRIAVATVGGPQQVGGVQKAMLRQCTHQHSKRCNKPLRSVPGSRGQTHAPDTRVITRVSIERRKSSAQQGALFSYEVLEPGAVFEGSIRNVPQGTLRLLESALKLPVHVGRGGSYGWGKVKVECLEKPVLAPLERRGAAFEQAVRAHFKAAQLPLDGVECLVPITFLAPLLPEHSHDDGRKTLAAALGKVVDWPVYARRFVRDGGWDQRLGRPVPELAVAGGAVYVARLSCPWHDPQMLQILRKLERVNVGRRRHQGYGHAIFFDPFILTRKQVVMNRSEHSQSIRPFRRNLVVAAERVITHARGTRLPSKTQFSRLVNVCGEATCAEEIVNYLRYQAGRETSKDWEVNFVDAVVRGIDDVLKETEDSALSPAARDQRRVELWQLYATYLTRAFTYQQAITGQGQKKTRGRQAR